MQVYERFVSTQYISDKREFTHSHFIPQLYIRALYYEYFEGVIVENKTKQAKTKKKVEKPFITGRTTYQRPIHLFCE